MALFNLIHDRKITIWERQRYNVEADTIEEATDILRKYVTQEDFNETHITPTQQEYLDNTTTVLEPEDNDGEETSTIMLDDGSMTMWSNGSEKVS